jgi:hypothetical protein
MTQRFKLKPMLPRKFVRVHEAILNSQYHPVFKFYAGLRGVQTARAVDEAGNRTYQIETDHRPHWKIWPGIPTPLRTRCFEPARLWLEHSQSAKWIQTRDANLEPLLQKGWGTTEQWFRWLGDLEVGRAWGDRGGGWTSSKAEKPPEGFAEHLSKAQQALEKAWQMNPNIAQTPYLMMRVELGQGQGLSRMELWFNRAMALQPNYYDAVKLMSMYPRTALVRFRREEPRFCALVRGVRQMGRVRLRSSLSSLHRTLASYSLRQQFTCLLASAPRLERPQNLLTTKFFSPRMQIRLAGGTDTPWMLLSVVNILFSWSKRSCFTEGTNVAYFGGPEKFQEMLQTAVDAGKQRGP